MARLCLVRAGALSLGARGINWETATGVLLILSWFGPVTSHHSQISVLIFPIDGTFALRLK